jgi:DNA polymerase-3 subunit delta
MKLNAQAAEEFAQYPQKFGAALVYGSDEGQVRQRVNQLIENWSGKADPPAEKMEYRAEDFIGEDAKSLADMCASFHLLASKQVILVRDATDTLVPLLDEAIASRNSDNLLILCCSEALPLRSKLRIWAEKERAIGVIACYTDEGRNLTQLIQQTLRGYGLRADTDTLDFLASQLGGDRQIIANELEKLSLYLGESADTCGLEDAMHAVGNNSAGSLDILSHAVASGNIETSCKLSDMLLQEGVMPVILVRSTMRYFNTLEQLAGLRQTGLNMEAAIEAIQPKVFFKHKATLRQHGARWGKNRIVAAQFILQKLELDCKRHHEQASLFISQGWVDIAALASIKNQRPAA